MAALPVYSFLLGLIPVLGVIPGVVYYRLTVVAHVRVRARHTPCPLASQFGVELDRALVRGDCLARPFRTRQRVAQREPVLGHAIVGEQRIAPEIRRLVPLATSRREPRSLHDAGVRRVRRVHAIGHP